MTLFDDPQIRQENVVLRQFRNPGRVFNKPREGIKETWPGYIELLSW